MPLRTAVRALTAFESPRRVVEPAVPKAGLLLVG